MIYSKKITLILALVFFFIANLKSQENLSRKVDPKTNLSVNRMIYFGIGTSCPNKAIKTDGYQTNIFGFNLSAFIPIYKKGTFTCGLNVGGEYFSSNKAQITTLPAAYNISGQQDPPSVTYNPNGNPKLNGYKFGAGPQFNFALGKHILISPILDFSYFSLTNQEFTIVQKTTVNTNFSSDRTYELLKQTTSKTTGPVFTSKIRIHYNIRRKMGVWVEVNYMFGPTVRNTTIQFKPNGKPNQNGYYTLFQMDNGTYNKMVNSTNYNSFGLNFGINFKI